MESDRYLECLAADAARLRDAAGRDLGVHVPSCPGWSSADLVRHTAEVYLHKAECMRLNAFPDPWPPDLTGEEPIALFDRSYAALTAEFAAREPGQPTVTWYDPDQTIGFWIRRMAQETVIHRVDAELAAGVPLEPIPSDLAIDGVDEVLVCFLGYFSTKYRSELSGLLDNCDGRAVGVSAGDRLWLTRLTKEGVVVTETADDAAATVSGEPDDVLLWLWGRRDDVAVATTGDQPLVAALRMLLVAVTQ